MDQNNNEQTELLRNIWNEMKALGQNLGAKIDKTNERLDKTNERLDAVRIELKQEISSVRTELKQEIAQLGDRLDRVETRLVSMDNRLMGVEGAIKELTVQHRWMSSFVETTFARHERDISQLKEDCARIAAHQEGH
jgi:predicted  nucleic acid-binding Zn-ribbon protein